MRAALGIGIDIINDVSALTHPESLSVAAGSHPDIVLMHMQGEPQTMNRAPSYMDVSLDVFDYLEARIDACGRLAQGFRRQDTGSSPARSPSDVPRRGDDCPYPGRSNHPGP
jgi:dihydropteroate synthase